MVNNHLNQFIAGDECQDNACYWNNHRLGDVSDHGKDRRREARRGHANIARNLANLCVDGIKHPRQIPHNAADQHSCEPFGDLIEYALHGLLPPVVN